MALTAIQQELWAAQLDAFLTTNTVASQICDTNLIPMEGGDTWHIVTPSDVSTFSVADGSDITYSLPTDADTSVTKNFDKGFGLLILDTNKMQAGYPGWEQAYAQNGAYQLGADLDTAVLANHAAAGANFYLTGSTAIQFTKTTCAEVPVLFAKLRKALRDQKVDNLGMPYLVGPPGLGEAIDTYTAGRESALGDQMLLSGGQRVFTFNGFRVFISNNCNTASSVTHGICGILNYGYALGTYVTPQAIELVGRSEGRYGDLIRGRVAAGYKVYRSASVLDVNFNSVVVATS